MLTNADIFQDCDIDAAPKQKKQFPPSGGFGLNSGLLDAHNLAWKLASVLRGPQRHELEKGAAVDASDEFANDLLTSYALEVFLLIFSAGAAAAAAAAAARYVSVHASCCCVCPHALCPPPLLRSAHTRRAPPRG